MGARWRAEGEWEVELINLNGKDCFRVRHFGALERYCVSLRELEEVLKQHGLRFNDLTEVDE